MNYKFIYTVATLVGTIIGVGFFSLPYIASKIGFFTMIVYFLVLGGLVVLVHLFFAELSLKTPDFKRLPGFAKIYLGSWGEKIAITSAVLGMFGSLLAYLIVGGEFLANLFIPFMGGSYFLYTIIYFLFGAILIFFGIKAIAKIEFWGMTLFFVILAILFLKGGGFINFQNLINKPAGFSFNNLFLPYGPILFSLWGAALIPETEEMLGGDKKMLKKTILIAVIIPLIVYILFTFLILGITGPNTTETALTGLKSYLGEGVLVFGFIFGIIATFTSFIAMGLTLKECLRYDFKIAKNFSWLIVCFVPLALFLAGIKNFISLISFIGGVMLGIDGILILLMYQKIAKKAFLVYPLILIFVGGIVYEMVQFAK